MLGIHLGIGDYLRRLQTELDRVDRTEVQCLSDLLFQAWQNGRFVFLFGNGHSGGTASAIAGDLGKNSLAQQDLDRVSGKRLKVLSLSDNVTWITALGNDLSYEHIFVQQLAHYASPGDLAIAISGSGNSPNVLRAVQWANDHGLMTFGMTGFNGGKLKQLQKAGIHIPLDDMAMVESIHLCIAHWLVDDLKARVNGLGRHAGRDTETRRHGEGETLSAW